MMLQIDEIIKTRFKLNGRIIYSNDPKELLYICFSSISDISFWSADAIKDFINGTFLSIIEYGKEIKKEMVLRNSPVAGDVSKKFTYFHSWCSRSSKRIPSDRDKLVRFVYDMILHCEGHGTLTGFGMSNKHKDKVPGNPERTTICELPIW
jgi:hypothetical protein